MREVKKTTTSRQQKEKCASVINECVNQKTVSSTARRIFLEKPYYLKEGVCIGKAVQ